MVIIQTVSQRDRTRAAKPINIIITHADRLTERGMLRVWACFMLARVHTPSSLVKERERERDKERESEKEGERVGREREREGCRIGVLNLFHCFKQWQL